MILIKLLKIYGRYWPFETKKIKLKNGNYKIIHHKFRNVNKLRKLINIKNKVITKIDKNIKILINPNDWMGWQFYFLGKYEPETTELIIKNSKKNKVFFDIGANIGFFSLLASKRGTKSYAFEASPFIAKIIEKNKRLNKLKTLKIINRAVFDKKIKLYFEKPEKDNIGTGKIVKKKSNSTIEVKSITIDEFVKKNKIKRVDFMKIDVEGVEINVLNGAKKTIDTFGPDIIIEDNYENNLLKKHLESKNYFGYYMKRKKKKILSINQPSKKVLEMFFTKNPKKYRKLIYK